MVCTACSYNATQQPCGLSNNPCGGFSGHFCAGTFAPDDLRRLDPEVLAVLKIQLRAALEKVDEADRAQAEQLRPQTLQEAESLENKLSAALAEVKEWHAELKARDAGKKPSK